MSKSKIESCDVCGRLFALEDLTDICSNCLSKFAAYEAERARENKQLNARLAAADKLYEIAQEAEGYIYFFSEALDADKDDKAFAKRFKAALAVYRKAGGG